MQSEDSPTLKFVKWREREGGEREIEAILVDSTVTFDTKRWCGFRVLRSKTVGHLWVQPLPPIQPLSPAILLGQHS